MSADAGTAAPVAALDLLSLSYAELEGLLASWGEKRFRAEQLFRALHAQGVRDVASITTLSKALRARLVAETRFGGLAERSTLTSAEDGSTKLVLEGPGGQAVETVVIPADDGRVTQCVSSQVGCKIGCTFCMTATMPLRRNLTAGEIVDQVYRGRVVAEASGERLSNLVFMGMGEPLDNLDNVVRAIELLTDPRGMAFPARRITVSTSGVVPRMAALGERVPVNLAISLNATTDEVRDRIMPINRRWPIGSIIEAVRAYPLDRRRRVTFEYVLLAGVNDSLEDAERLVDLVRGLPAKINLIPFNPWPGAAYGRPGEATIDAFCRLLANADVSVTVRRSRGRDIGAACGQLDGA